MIRIIGIKRLVILLVLIGTNAFLASVIYMYVLPEKEKTDQDLTMLRGQLSSVEGDIAKMQVEFAQLEERQALFDKLKAHGYFSTQDRGDAKQLFSDIQEKANVVSVVVSVKSGVIEENAEAQKANHKVLMSPIDIQIKAFDDGDIYRYINLIEKMFPGHVSLDGITMKRSRDVTAALLRAIANGASPELVTADIRMSWRTMIPEDQVILDTGLKR